MAQRARYRVKYRRGGKVRTAIVNTFSAADARKHYKNVISVTRDDSHKRPKSILRDNKPRNKHWFY